jgi:hypothetical protein
LIIPCTGLAALVGLMLIGDGEEGL